MEGRRPCLWQSRHSSSSSTADKPCLCSHGRSSRPCWLCRSGDAVIEVDWRMSGSLKATAARAKCCWGSRSAARAAAAVCHRCCRRAWGCRRRCNGAPAAAKEVRFQQRSLKAGGLAAAAARLIRAAPYRVVLRGRGGHWPAAGPAWQHLAAGASWRQQGTQAGDDVLGARALLWLGPHAVSDEVGHLLWALLRHPASRHGRVQQEEGCKRQLKPPNSCSLKRSARAQSQASASPFSVAALT